MLAVFQRTEHVSTLPSRGSGEPDKPIELRFGPVGCRYAQPTVDSINGDAVKKRVKARRRGFEHILSFMLAPPREGIKVVLVFSERRPRLWHFEEECLSGIPVQYMMTLVDELYMKCSRLATPPGGTKSQGLSPTL